MTPGEILDHIDEFDDDATIWVAASPEEASETTPAVVVRSVMNVHLTPL